MDRAPTTEAKARILVVEDELIIAKGLEKRLRALGYTVTDTVASGEEGVVSAKETRPDLVLMDICLQGKMDGVTAAEKIRIETGIPVVYLTAFADSDTLSRAKVTEPFGYIVKPFQDFTLKSSIEMALYKHRMERELRRSKQLLTLKNQIANIFLTVPDEEMYGEVLNSILDFMGCPYGFFGYVGESGDFVIPSLKGWVWERCEVPGKDIVFSPECWKRLWGRALREGVAYFSSGPFSLPEGHIPISSCLVAPLLAKGSCVGLLAVADKAGGFDESDRELLESIAVRTAPILHARLLRDREEKERKKAEMILRRVFDTIPDLFSIIDRNFRVVLSNWHGGYDHVSEEVRRSNPYCYNVYYGLDEPCEDCHVREIFVTGKPVIRQKYNPKVGHLEIFAYPIFDESGNVEMVTEHIRDITEKRRMEEELFKAQKLESVGVLAGGIAHDFNNLLTAILGNISLSKMYVTEGEKIYQRLAEAEKASLRARDLTQQLLTFSRGGAPVKRSTHVSDIVRDAAAFALSGSKTTCLFDIPDDLWPVEVDEGQISQVIHNLIINADQAMPSGGVVEVKCENVLLGEKDLPPLRAGCHVSISIRDYGVGISPDVLSRIFDPYFTTRKNGKGLGLTMVYSIVRNHEGHITVTTEPGEGTTFTVYLPCGSGAAPPEREKEAASEAESPEVLGKILLMDDEENIREVAGEMLSFIGYGVEFAGDGAEAVKLYEKALAAGEPYAAVILDLTVPGGMGGREAMEILRNLDPEVKAVVSSGYSNDPIMSDYKTFGFRGIITKPYKLTDLRKVLSVVTG